MKKKSLLIGLLTTFMVLGISNTEIAHANSNATSMYVNSTQSQSSDIITIDWSAIKNPPNTYWAVHNWNSGDEAGGYAGFQQQIDNRTVHFAIWDPISVRQPINAEYLSPNSNSSRFGGEGEGMKVETTYQWEPNNWYKMTMRSWQEDGHTKFGQWVRDESTKQWTQIAILDFPVANVNFNSPCGMFQEDWAGNGDQEREARLKNSYSRASSNKTWNSLNKQQINVQYPDKNWNGGGNSEYIWVSAGGNTKPSISDGQVFTLNQPSKPNLGNLDFDIKNNSYNSGMLNISWKLKDKSTPQFKGKIEIYNNSSMKGLPIKTIDNIKSYKNEINETASLNISNDIYAKVILTDLFDNTVTKTVKLNSNETPNEYKDPQVLTDDTSVVLKDTWNSNISYPTPGTSVIFEGNTYKNRWWINRGTKPNPKDRQGYSTGWKLITV